MITLPGYTQQEEIYAAKIHIQGKREHKFNTFQLTKYILDNEIHGDFAEAGVAGGGHIAYIHQVLKSRGITDRKIHLYDSFIGHPKGDGTDNPEVQGKYGVNKDIKNPIHAGRPESEISTRAHVEQNMGTWHVNPDLLVYHEGFFQNVLPEEEDKGSLPEKLAFLRVDVNLNISTKFIMDYLHPLVVKGGVIVNDDWSSLEIRRTVFDSLDYEPEIYPVDEQGNTVWWIKKN